MGSWRPPLPGCLTSLLAVRSRRVRLAWFSRTVPAYLCIIQAWLWLKKPTWFLDRCSRAYGDVFTMRLPLASTWSTSPALSSCRPSSPATMTCPVPVRPTTSLPLVAPQAFLVLDGPEHLRQRKLILPLCHGDRMRPWESSVREITRAEIARWPVDLPFALRPSMQSITLDVIVRVVFGVDGSARSDELRRRILTLTAIGHNPSPLPHARPSWARTPRGPVHPGPDALYAALAEEIRQRRHGPTSSSAATSCPSCCSPATTRAAP